MAKVQYSSVVGDARGKIGGNVATKGRFGAVMRRKTSPVQPRTSFQRKTRSTFTANTKGWGALASDTIRAAWDSFAKANPVKDVFGNTVHLTGHQMYVRLNQVILRCAGTKIDLPPLSLVVGEPGIVTVAAIVVDGHTITVSHTVAPDTYECAEVWAAAPMGAGRKFVGGGYRLIFVGEAGVSGDYEVAAEYEARFGTIQLGQVIRVKLKFANDHTGAQGLGSAASDVAAAT